MSNWDIEKLVEDIWVCHKLGHAPMRETFKSIVMSHAPQEPTRCAPVIDAEKLAERIEIAMPDWFEDEDSNAMMAARAILIDTITSNLDLSITWVNNKARWGVFELCTIKISVDGAEQWNWYIDGLRSGTKNTCGTKNRKLLAEAACVDALKLIVTGSKE